MDLIRPNVRKPGQFDSVSRNCSCAGVFKSLKPIFAENKHEIIEKNEISPLFVGKNFLFCRICCSVGWCNERPQNQIRNLITKEESIFFFEQNFPRNDNNCQIFVSFQFWENGSHFQNFPKHKTVQHYLLTSSFDNSILDEVQSMVVDWPEIG